MFTLELPPTLNDLIAAVAAHPGRSDLPLVPTLSNGLVYTRQEVTFDNGLIEKENPGIQPREPDAVQTNGNARETHTIHHNHSGPTLNPISLINIPTLAELRKTYQRTIPTHEKPHELGDFPEDKLPFLTAPSYSVMIVPYSSKTEEIMAYLRDGSPQLEASLPSAEQPTPRVAHLSQRRESDEITVPAPSYLDRAGRVELARKVAFQNRAARNEL